MNHSRIGTNIYGIYIRTSTKAQNKSIKDQRRYLGNFCKARNIDYEIYQDVDMSGALSSRPSYRRLLKDAHMGRLDGVIVYRLDRFSRNTEELIVNINYLISLGMKFMSYTEGLDFNTPHGIFQFHILSALAQYEIDRTSVAIKNGMQMSKEDGKKFGRPPISPSKHKEIIDLYLSDKSLSCRKIGAKAMASHGTVHKTLKEFKLGKLDNLGNKKEGI